MVKDIKTREEIDFVDLIEFIESERWFNQDKQQIILFKFER